MLIMLLRYLLIDINIEMDENFHVLLSTLDSDLYPRFFQTSSVGPRPVFREISNEELEVEEETILTDGVVFTGDITGIPQ